MNMKLPGIKITDDFEIEDNVLTGYRGHAKKIVVPDTVKIIGEGVFSRPFGYGKAVRVTIPEGVTEIQKDAFLSSDLEEIELPSTLKIIGENAFADCRNLRSVTLPEGVKEIRDFAFMKSGLEEVHLPKYLKSIGLRAFRDCRELKKINSPEGKKLTVDLEAFYGCTGLLDENGLVVFHGRLVYFEAESRKSPVYVNIPDHVASIEDKLFYQYPSVHLTMSLNCPLWNTYGDQQVFLSSESIIMKAGSSIAFRDTDGKIAAKVILATENEDWVTVQSFICSIRNRPDGGFDFAKYDSIFSDLKRPRNKEMMALLRLRYPWELPEDMEKEYAAFLRENCADVCICMIEKELSVLDMSDEEILRVLEKKKAMNPDVIWELITYAQGRGENELIAELLDYQKKKFGEEDVFRELDLSNDPDDSTL